MSIGSEAGSYLRLIDFVYPPGVEGLLADGEAVVAIDVSLLTQVGGGEEVGRFGKVLFWASGSRCGL